MNQILFKKGGFSQKRLNPRFCGLYHWIPWDRGNPMVLPPKTRIFVSNFINLLRREKELNGIFSDPTGVYSKNKLKVHPLGCSGETLRAKNGGLVLVSGLERCFLRQVIWQQWALFSSGRNYPNCCVKSAFFQRGKRKEGYARLKTSSWLLESIRTRGTRCIAQSKSSSLCSTT